MLLVIGDSGRSFEGPRKRTDRSSSRPSSVSRNLFGTADRSQNRLDLCALNERLMNAARERWNFDFPTGRPVDEGGRYEWVSGVTEAASPPSAGPCRRMTVVGGESSGPFVDVVGSEKSPGDNSARTLSVDVISIASSRVPSSRDTGSSASLRRCVAAANGRCVSGISRRWKRVSKAIRKRRPSIQSPHRTNEETPSPLITDYFWKKKYASSAECNRQAK